jgi:PAS domain S-box-containing protein
VRWLRAAVDFWTPAAVRAQGHEPAARGAAIVYATALVLGAGVAWLAIARDFPAILRWLVAAQLVGIALIPLRLRLTASLTGAVRALVVQLLVLLVSLGIANGGRGPGVLAMWAVALAALLLPSLREALAWMLVSALAWAALLLWSRSSLPPPIAIPEPLAADAWRSAALLLVPVAVVAFLVLDGVRRAALRDLDMRRDELQRSRALYRSLLDAAPDAILVLVGSERVGFANARAAELFEYGAADLIGRRADTLLRQDDRGARGRFLAAGELAPTRTRALTMRGAEVPVEVRATAIEFEGEPAALVHIRDTRVEDAEQARLRLFAAAFERSRDSIFAVDGHGVIRYANPAGIEAFSSSPANEVIGRTAEEVLGSFVRRLTEDVGREIREGRLPESGRISRTSPRGETEHWEYSLIPVELANEPVPVYVGIARDVTAEANLEESRREAARLGSVAQLAGGVAHDINNQVQVVFGRLEQLRDGPAQDPAEWQRDLEVIRTAARRSAAVTQQLLAFARVAPLHLQSVDVDELVARIPGLVQGVLRDSIRLEVERMPGVPPLLGDRARLEQALLGLVWSAGNAIEGAGTIRLETAVGPLPASLGRAGETAPGRFVCIRVRDDARSADAEMRRKMFEPFAAGAAGPSGSRLELPGAHGAIVQSGGHVTVESVPGLGTCVALYLPAADELAVDGRREEGPPAEEDRAGALILVVDDEPEVRLVAQRALERAGYRTLVAGSASEALASIRAHAVDLVVTDLAMPRGSGIALAEELARSEPGLPVLFVTAYSAAAADHHEPSPTRGLLPKPYESHELLARVRGLLASARAETTPVASDTA